MVENLGRLCTLVIVCIVVIAGGVVVIVHPETLTFKQYIEAVALGAGLLGIGYGLDSQSKP